MHRLQSDSVFNYGGAETKQEKKMHDSGAINYVDVCVSDNFLTFYIIMQLKMEIKLMLVDLCR